VFDSLEDLAQRIDAPDLDVSPTDVLVLKNAGPKGAPGMPEAGYLPIPTKLSRAGVTDMIRISDARMSGTAFGTIVLHVTPEAAAGGPLALVRTGDAIRLSVKERRLDLLVDEAEQRRRQATTRADAQGDAPSRGFRRLYLDHVLQADAGCDFDFLQQASTPTSRV
jgi:dihydroxyacid dehydratase/phosphogluconate dehydratase